MSEENKAITRRWMEELWSQGNSGAADELIAPDYTVHDPGTPGRAGGRCRNACGPPTRARFIHWLMAASLTPNASAIWRCGQPFCLSCQAWSH
jgi:hypothetical protein